MSFLEVAIQGALVLLGFALVLTSIRLIKGPSVADRVVALDLIAIEVVGFALLFAIRERNSIYADLALVVAILGFASTVAFARFLEERNS